MAHPWSHGGDEDARLLRKELPQLGDGLLHEVDRPAQLAGPDSDPELRRVQPETGDLCRDPDRLMSVEGKDPDAELQLRGGCGDVCERLQAGRARLIVRPQRMVPKLLTADRQVTSESRVETRADAQPPADRRRCVHDPVSVDGSMFWFARNRLSGS
jgi:hypothetical protein